MVGGEVWGGVGFYDVTGATGMGMGMGMMIGRCGITASSALFLLCGYVCVWLGGRQGGNRNITSRIQSS